jgi:RNA polymerase sigma-70 factor (ECF subfamily)
MHSDRATDFFSVSLCLCGEPFEISDDGTRSPVSNQDRQALFEQAVLPHLNAAYNLARWLTRNPDDAADVVQEAYLRALRYFDGFAGEDGKAWLLSIVRHTCFTWLRRNRPAELAPLPDETADGGGHGVEPGDPETLTIAARDRALLNRLIADLPPEFREVVVLRELEELSYREIAAIAAIPVGTVMSRLARARARLRRDWRRLCRPETDHGA